MCGPPREQCLGGSDYGNPRTEHREGPSAEDRYMSDCISRDMGADEKEIYFMKYRKFPDERTN